MKIKIVLTAIISQFTVGHIINILTETRNVTFGKICELFSSPTKLCTTQKENFYSTQPATYSYIGTIYHCKTNNKFAINNKKTI